MTTVVQSASERQSRTDRPQRPGLSAARVDGPAPSPATTTFRDDEETVLITCWGRRMIARASMAGIFLRHAHDVVLDDGWGLVPLLHEDGVDLLLITATTPLTVTDILM